MVNSKHVKEIGWSHVRIGGRVYKLLGYPVRKDSKGKAKTNKKVIRLQEIAQYCWLKKTWTHEVQKPIARPIEINVYVDTMLIYCPLAPLFVD